MMRVGVLVIGLVLTMASAGGANCLARSQNAIAAVQLANAYSISRYTWAGDPQYDQVMPLCSRTAIREFACNAAVHVAIRLAEDRAVTRRPESERAVCVANYIGALLFATYIRHAIGVQLLSVRL